MEKLSLKVEKRTKEEKLKNLRESKLIPAVVYWHSQESTLIKIDYSSFLRTYRKSWNSHIINLELGSKKIDVLVHDMQKEPVSWNFSHVDFYAITKWEKVTTKIPLAFVWTSSAVKEWAILEEHLKEIELKCQASDLIDNFEVDLSKLENMGDSIRVSDLNIDEKKFEVLTNSDDIVALAAKPQKVVEETETNETETSEEWEKEEEK